MKKLFTAFLAMMLLLTPMAAMAADRDHDCAAGEDCLGHMSIALQMKRTANAGDEKLIEGIVHAVVKSVFDSPSIILRSSRDEAPDPDTTRFLGTYMAEYRPSEGESVIFPLHAWEYVG